YDEKRELFAKAVASHSGYIRDATQGKGVDRHLLALRTLLTEEELSASPEEGNIFKDPAYALSSHFKLSTSNVSPGRHWMAGFGPVVPDGYGVAYAIDTDSIQFGLSAKRSSQLTVLGRFRETLGRSLKDMMILFPKRSEVWGKSWRRLLEREQREARALRTMKKLSDRYSAAQEATATRRAASGDDSQGSQQ
ncbi:hypothetical protein HK405_003776, partial [Cladochytrium tenue]